MVFKKGKDWGRVACFLYLFLVMAALASGLGSCTTTTDTAKKQAIWPERRQAIVQSKVKGFGILYRIPGQWHGPVTSDTPAGNFGQWYVDFRPVAPAQISQFSTVAPSMCNFVTFMVIKHEGELKVAMRTDAVFQNKGCITYEVMHTVDEKKGYYKFADFQSGDKRAYTEFIFAKEGLEMRVYTNKFNKLRDPKLHAKWRATRASVQAALPAIKHFDYPQAVAVKDFTDVFGNAHESLFFSRAKDPYPAKNEPYVGKATFNITIAEKLKVSPKDELFLMLTTKPIFQGTTYVPERLNYISKLIYLPIDQRQYTLTHIHPGTYYLYAYNDINQDRRHKSGDYIASRLEHKITVPPAGHIEVNTKIDFVIP
jgi:hypothetical protein